MDNANFIPLGIKNSEGAVSGPVPPPPKSKRTKEVVWGPRVIEQTKEERSRIAREIRKNDRKERKQIRAAAKAAKKANAALHRTVSKNTEKYNKNKERNKQRAIAIERHKIRVGAVRQAERLAAIHDPSGKSFHVGEIIMLPGGIVKTKEGMRKTAEATEQKEKEEAARKAADLAWKEADQAAREEALEAQRAAEEGRPVPTHFPAREALKRMVRPKRVSKKQLERQQMLKKLQDVPPKPIIPEGISLPAGEENLLALWDITDQEIKKRLRNQKKQKLAGRKDLKKVQKENKKLKRELKLRKKRAEDAGVAFDKAEARREIVAEQALLAQQKAARGEKAGSQSDSESGSGSGSDSDSGSESDDGAKTEGKKEETEEKAEAKSDMQEEKPLRSRVPAINLELPQNAGEADDARKAKKLATKDRRRQERRAKMTDEDLKAEAARAAQKEAKAARKAAKLPTADGSEAESSKKRKRDQDEEVEEAVEGGKKERSHKKKKARAEDVVDEVMTGEMEVETEADRKKREKKEAKREAKAAKEASASTPEEAAAPKKEKKSKTQGGEDKASGLGAAEQWNPDALKGDAARKNKFLRLLGAGKQAGKEAGEKKDKKSLKMPGVDIDKISADLERQFEAGTKMKHDGGGKRRGLGA